jgi:hypothetical protein
LKEIKRKNRFKEVRIGINKKEGKKRSLGLLLLFVKKRFPKNTFGTFFQYNSSFGFLL